MPMIFGPLLGILAGAAGVAGTAAVASATGSAIDKVGEGIMGKDAWHGTIGGQTPDQLAAAAQRQNQLKIAQTNAKAQVDAAKAAAAPVAAAPAPAAAPEAPVDLELQRMSDLRRRLQARQSIFDSSSLSSAGLLGS